ncbi:MAG: response regulator transcription factor [Bacteroidota bacterium]
MNGTPKHMLIVDDHVVFVNGLVALLTPLKEWEVSAVAHNGNEALKKLEALAIDLVITDISMPEMDGISFISKARELSPSLKIIVLSMHNESKVIKSILKLNPDGFILKNTDAEELVHAIRSVMSGKQYYSEEIKNILVDDLRGISAPSTGKLIPSLSQREQEVLELIANEMTTSEIAEKLFLSLHTIETYRKNLLRKLEAKNSVGLVARAYQLGILES